jgi:hypothetical protein
MDRSFLSQPEVVAASRQFVCVRLATYEDRDEAAFLKSFNVTRSGELENTVFSILSPDGKRELVRGSRSANHTFGDAQRMAEAMQRLSRQYGDRPAVAGGGALPRVANVRLALDIAACDNLPLVVMHAENPAALEKRIGTLAWSEEFIGRFIFVAATDAKELAQIEGAGARSGILVVQPDRFGLKGTVLASTHLDASVEALAKCLRDGLAQAKQAGKQFAGHVRDGREQGVFWETTVPVSDPMEQRARERGRRGGPPE